MDNPLLFSGFIILLFVLMSAFFSAAETALTAISRARIYQLVIDGNKRAEIVSRLRREKEAMIGTVLLGNTAVNVGASALATTLAVTFFGSESAVVVVVTFGMTILLVVFSEILPKTYAIQHSERVALALAYPLHLLVRLLYPITYTVQRFIRVLFKCFGVDITKTDTLISTTDLLRGTIELHHREGRMVKQDRDMLGSILDLNDVEVQKIMVHRKHVETLDAGMAPEQFVSFAFSTLHSRLPVWRGEPDNIIGVLHTKDLIRLLGERRDKAVPLTIEAILSICNKPWFIPETTSLRDQLLAFRSKRQHIALVVDEYGAWQGIVTLEDIMEEIVGDIEDEHDEAESDVQKAGDHVYFVNGSLPVRDLNRRLEWNLPEEEASTVAGLLIHEVQAIPNVGERFDLHGFRFTVMGKDATQVTRLRVEKLPETKLPEDVEV